MIDAIYCVSLGRLPERRNFVLDLLRPYQDRFDIHFFEAIEGFGIYESWPLTDSNNWWWSRRLKLGSLCNLLGHYSIWKHIYRNGYGSALILEDDVRIVGNFLESLSIASVFMKNNDCDIFYLGCTPVGGYETTPVNDIIDKVGYTYNAHAYIVTKNSAKELFSSGIKNNLITNDEYITSTYCEHPREDIRNLYSNRKLNAYRLIDEVISQRIGHDGFIGHLGGMELSEIENSDFL